MKRIKEVLLNKEYRLLTYILIAVFVVLWTLTIGYFIILSVALYTASVYN